MGQQTGRYALTIRNELAADRKRILHAGSIIRPRGRRRKQHQAKKCENNDRSYRHRILVTPVDRSILDAHRWKKVPGGVNRVKMSSMAVFFALDAVGGLRRAAGPALPIERHALDAANGRFA